MTRVFIPRRAALAVVGTVFALLGPQVGSALADRYVTKGGFDTLNSCKEEAHPCATIGHALLNADPNERIQIGPGTFTESLVAHKPVVLDGNGGGTLRGIQPATRTIIVAGPLVHEPAIELEAGGEIRDLRAVGSQQGDAVIPTPAIKLGSGPLGAAAPTTIDDVIAVGGLNDLGAAGAAIMADGLESFHVTLTDSGLAHASDEWGQPLLELHNATATVTNVLTDPSPRGQLVRALGDSQADITGLDQVENTVAGTGLLADSKGRINLTRSRVKSRGPALAVYAQTAAHTPSTATVTDSALMSVGSTPHLSAVFVQGNQDAVSEVTLRRTTVLAYGPDVKSALWLQSSGAGGRATALAEDSIIRATDPAIALDSDVHAVGQTGGAATFTATRTAFSNVSLSGNATATDPSAAGNIAGNPLLADEAAGHLSLQPGSPLIDRGSATGLAADALDLAGSPRSTDGNADCTAAPDLGAYERPAVTPCTPAPPEGGGGAGGGGTPTPPTLDTRAPLLTNLRLSTALLRSRATVRWSLDEAATVRIAIQRRAPGRRFHGRCVAPNGKAGKPCTRWVTRAVLSAPAAAGPSKMRIARRVGGRRLALGTYRLRLVARDAAGNRSLPGIARFSVVNSVRAASGA